jgi:RHS repeat-associated protein
VSVLKYDVNDRLIEEDDAAGFATRYAYDGNGNRKSVTDPLGHTTSYAFDGLNRLTKTTKPAGEIETIDYDEDLTDGVGIDASGVAQGLQFAAGVADGSAVRTTSPAGVVVISVKDALGRVVREQKGVGAGAQRITTNFDGATAITPSRPFALAQTQVTDPLGNQSLFNRDGNDAIIEVLDAEGKLTKAVVNAIGESLSERDPTGLGFDCSYDVLGRKTACTDTAGATTSQAYDVADNVIRKTDGLGKVVTTEYDGRNLPITVIDENNQFSRYRYDGLTNLTSVLDVESKTTSYGYDTRGLRTKVTYSDGRTTTTAYDGARRVSSVTDQLNQTITLVYDADGRLISRRYQDNLNDSFSYDADSRLTLAHSSRYNNDVRRIYDNQNRMTSETVSSDGSNRVTQQVFDAADRVTSVTYPNGSVLSKSYNKRHELTGLSFDGVAVANMVRDDAGRPTITTLGNGLRETRTFRQDELLGSVQLSKPSSGAVLASLTYAFDAAKRKTQEKNTLTPSETENFAYDNLDRLTNFAQGSNSQTWVLSPAGNWQNTVRNGAVENRGHGPAYEVTSVTTNVTANLLTDARGSITKDEVGTAYTWDLDNQLQKTVTAGGATTSYTYDALGRRLSRTSGGVKTVFVNEGDRETARPLVEYENGAFRRSYVYGEYIDQLAMMVVGTARYYFTVNEHFSPQAVTDAWGAVVERYRYDAYGQRTVLNGAGVAIPSSTIGNRVGFTGRVHEDSGLVHYRTRYYRPFLGRFVTRDADFTDGPNLYAAYFVPNSLDPTGQWGLKSLVKGVAKVAQKVVAKVEATVKKTGVSLAVVANFKIEGNGTLSFCVGDLTLEGKMSWEVGAKGQAFGVSTFIGIQGDKSLGKVMFHPFDGFGCRGDCDTCCQPVNSVAVNANSTGFFSALKKLEDSLGFEITVGVKSDGCRSEASVKISADLLPLIPAVGQVIMAINKTRVISVHAGLQGGGTIKSCRSRQQTMVMEDGLLMLGLFGKVGAAVSTG